MSFLIPDINTFFLLHTHFFSLLVYHVPILSCNPTVYTLCTVSTWGSVYVGQHNSRFGNQGAGNRHTLLLAAGEIVRHIFEFSLQAESVDNLFYKACISLAAVDLNGVHDVLIHIEDREQIVVLKNKADVSAAKNG